MTNLDADRRKPLPMKCSPAEIADYACSDRPAGHEGQPPEFITRKEFPWVDGKKVASDSNFNVNHSRVCFLFTHKRIEERQFLAAERLATDYEKSQMQPRASQVIVGNGASGGTNGTFDSLQNKIDAGGRYEDALKALGRAADVIALVVITNLTVGKAAEHLRMDPQRAWGRFELALHILADHYRM